jgi:hypothetical protein
MKQDNFVAQPHRQLVRRYRDWSAWDDLDNQPLTEIADRLSDSARLEQTTIPAIREQKSARIPPPIWRSHRHS